MQKTSDKHKSKDHIWTIYTLLTQVSVGKCCMTERIQIMFRVLWDKISEIDR